MKLPDFIICGCMKCGTGSLQQNLAQVPGIFMLPKECHFFDIEWTRGIEWYKKRFPEDGRVCGEKTPIYILRPHYIRRMAQTIPQSKYIILFRNPVDRAYSHYRQIIRVNKEKRGISFKDLIRADLERIEQGIRTVDPRDYDNTILPRGFYDIQFINFLASFDRSQLFVLITEKMAADTERAVKKTVEFLGVSSERVSEIPLRRKAPTGYLPMGKSLRDQHQFDV